MTACRSAAYDLAADLFCLYKLALVYAQKQRNSKHQCYTLTRKGALVMRPFRVSLSNPLYRFFDTLTARVGKLTDPGFLGHRVNQALSYVTMLGHFIYQGT